MKKLILLPALLALCAVSAPAQQYAVSSNLIHCAANTTTNPAIVFGVQKYEDITIQVESSLAGAGTDTTTLTFLKSADGTTYETTGSVVMHITNAGTLSQCAVSNITMGATGYLKLQTLQNGDANDIVTGYVRVAKKPQRFGK